MLAVVERRSAPPLPRSPSEFGLGARRVSARYLATDARFRKAGPIRRRDAPVRTTS
jgi:hypothetical protein